MPKIKLPMPFRPHADGQKWVEVGGSTVLAAVDALVTRCPRLRQQLFDQGGDLRPYVIIFLNGENIGESDVDRTPVEEGDQLMIVPTIAGGHGWHI